MTESTWVRLYARGFFLSPTSIAFLDELEHYRCIELTDYCLYADTITEIGVARDGSDWLVTIGKLLPLSTGDITATGDDIADELLHLLQHSGLKAVETALYDIAGRHAIILKTGGKVYAYHDAGGHRTVYFSSAQRLIASHFDMLHRLTGVQEYFCPVGSKNPKTSPDGLWDITENPYIKALLPNHRLALLDGTQTRFGLQCANPYINVAWQEKIELVHRLWHEQLQQLFELRPKLPLGVSLSGGLDSRTVLAHMRPYIENIRAFTYTAANVKTGAKPTSFWQRTMTTDHNILCQMADHLPQDFHVLVKPSVPSLTESDNKILARNAVRNHGRPYVPMYKDLFPDINSIHVRGNFVEMGRLIRGNTALPEQRDRLAAILEEVVRRRRPSLKAYTKFFWAKVEEFQYEALHHDVEYTDVYHWENRSSRWYAEIVNETDTVFDSIVPVNARRIYQILTSPNANVRPGAQFQTDLIHRAWPELLTYGINSEEDLYTTTLRQQLLEGSH